MALLVAWNIPGTNDFANRLSENTVFVMRRAFVYALSGTLFDFL